MEHFCVGIMKMIENMFFSHHSPEGKEYLFLGSTFDLWTSPLLFNVTSAELRIFLIPMFETEAHTLTQKQQSISYLCPYITLSLLFFSLTPRSSPTAAPTDPSINPGTAAL